jgi:L-asparaginase / beta-aspartyl-peptidase
MMKIQSGCFAILIAAVACQPSTKSIRSASLQNKSALIQSNPRLLAGGQERGDLVVTHVGAGSPAKYSKAARSAASEGLKTLQEGKGVLDAAVESTVVLEDDPRFNAGTGANIRLDGKTIQMDASLMTSEGRFAAVGVIERVKNPIRVTQRVLETPHLFLAGEGARRFAHKIGFQDVIPTCDIAKAKYRSRLKRLTKRLKLGKEGFNWRKYWNFPGGIPAELKSLAEGGDTVGTVARDKKGRFAATLSTGGTSVTLHGRVGDVPVYGAGLYAGPHGAIACTGHGEEIIKNAVARSVYKSLAKGLTAKEAIRQAIQTFPKNSSIGIIAVDKNGWGVGSNRNMAYGKAAKSVY